MRRSAFTLIELLITISIIGILTAIATVSYSGVRLRGRDAQRQSDLNAVKVAESSYYNSQVPLSYVQSASKITLNGSTDALTAALVPNYMKAVPLDPVNAGSNVYKYQSFTSGRDFTLFATFENKNNKKGWAGGSAWAADGFQISNE